MKDNIKYLDKMSKEQKPKEESGASNFTSLHSHLKSADAIETNDPSFNFNLYSLSNDMFKLCDGMQKGNQKHKTTEFLNLFN